MEHPIVVKIGKIMNKFWILDILNGIVYLKILVTVHGGKGQWRRILIKY